MSKLTKIEVEILLNGLRKLNENYLSLKEKLQKENAELKNLLMRNVGCSNCNYHKELQKETAELRKQNEELINDSVDWDIEKTELINHISQLENLVDERAWDIFCNLNEELAELKANGIFPKFKVGDKPYIHIFGKAEQIFPISDIQILYKFGEAYTWTENYLFLTESEAQAALEEMKKCNI